MDAEVTEINKLGFFCEAKHGSYASCFGRDWGSQRFCQPALQGFIARRSGCAAGSFVRSCLPFAPSLALDCRGGRETLFSRACRCHFLSRYSVLWRCIAAEHKRTAQQHSKSVWLRPCDPSRQGQAGVTLQVKSGDDQSLKGLYWDGALRVRLQVLRELGQGPRLFPATCKYSATLLSSIAFSVRPAYSFVSKP